MPVRNGHSEPSGDDDDSGDPRDACNPFAPPAVPVEVCCMHCGQVFESWQMVWLDEEDLPDGGVWCCPTPGCDGIGFGFDVWPINRDPADVWRVQPVELSDFDPFADDADVVDPHDDILDESQTDDADQTTDAADEVADPRWAYITSALIYELLQTNEDWYHFFHQHDPKSPSDPRDSRHPRWQSHSDDPRPNADPPS